jgi:glycosyltransferase involved in cell wall biosynthesis
MSGRRQILWVSTIRQIKRPGLFLELARKLPELDFKMIGGPGRNETALYETIRTDADGIPNLAFLGFVPYSRIEAHFDDAALLINTSESEGFPNAFLQAWARGIPSISFVDAGARLDGELIGVQVGSFDEMFSKVHVLMSDEVTRARLGETCRTYVVSNHSPQKIVATYNWLFADLMQ